MEVGIAELVKHVTKLVEQAEHGEEITIRRHGKPVAKLLPAENPKPKRRFGTLKDVVKLRDGWNEDLPFEVWDTARQEKTNKRKRKK